MGMWEREGGEGVLGPVPNVQAGEGVWVYVKGVEGKGGRVASTDLKSGWGLRLRAASKAEVRSAAILVGVGGLVAGWLLDLSDREVE